MVSSYALGMPALWRIKDRARSVCPSVLLTVCVSLLDPGKLLSNKHDGDDDDSGGGGTFSDGNYWCCTNISSRRPAPQFVFGAI